MLLAETVARHAGKSAAARAKSFMLSGYLGFAKDICVLYALLGFKDMRLRVPASPPPDALYEHRLRIQLSWYL
jgi:hypothetical protein